MHLGIVLAVPVLLLVCCIETTRRNPRDAKARLKWALCSLLPCAAPYVWIFSQLHSVERNAMWQILPFYLLLYLAAGYLAAAPKRRRLSYTLWCIVGLVAPLLSYKQYTSIQLVTSFPFFPLNLLVLLTYLFTPLAVVSAVLLVLQARGKRRNS